MKKLLLLLFSLLLSFNSFGEENTVGGWFKAFAYDGTSWYINLEKIQERDGLVYFWYMSTDDEDSETALTENDCMLTRSKYLQQIQYSEPMMEGEAIYLPNNNEWTYFPPDSIGDALQMIACELAPKSLEEREENMTVFQGYVEEVEEEERQSNLTEAQQTLQASWVGSVAEKVKSNWRYQGAEDDWWCEVYVLQKRNGEVLAVEIDRCQNLGANTGKAQAFKNSLERAVYKSSPLPSAPNDSVFNEEIKFVFFVN